MSYHIMSCHVVSCKHTYLVQPIYKLEEAAKLTVWESTNQLTPTWEGATLRPEHPRPKQTHMSDQTTTLLFSQPRPWACSALVNLTPSTISLLFPCSFLPRSSLRTLLDRHVKLQHIATGKLYQRAETAFQLTSHSSSAPCAMMLAHHHITPRHRPN